MQNAERGTPVDEGFVAEVCRLADADRRTVLAVLAGLPATTRSRRRAALAIAKLRAPAQASGSGEAA